MNGYKKDGHQPDISALLLFYPVPLPVYPMHPPAGKENNLQYNTLMHERLNYHTVHAKEHILMTYNHHYPALANSRHRAKWQIYT